MADTYFYVAQLEPLGDPIRPEDLRHEMRPAPAWPGAAPRLDSKRAGDPRRSCPFPGHHYLAALPAAIELDRIAGRSWK